MGFISELFSVPYELGSHVSAPFSSKRDPGAMGFLGAMANPEPIMQREQLAKYREQFPNEFQTADTLAAKGDFYGASQALIGVDAKIRESGGDPSAIMPVLQGYAKAHFGSKQAATQSPTQQLTFGGATGMYDPKEVARNTPEAWKAEAYSTEANARAGLERAKTTSEDELRPYDRDATVALANQRNAAAGASSAEAGMHGEHGKLYARTDPNAPHTRPTSWDDPKVLQKDADLALREANGYERQIGQLRVKGSSLTKPERERAGIDPSIADLQQKAEGAKQRFDTIQARMDELRSGGKKPEKKPTAEPPPRAPYPTDETGLPEWATARGEGSPVDISAPPREGGVAAPPIGATLPKPADDDMAIASAALKQAEQEAQRRGDKKIRASDLVNNIALLTGDTGRAKAIAARIVAGTLQQSPAANTKVRRRVRDAKAQASGG